jgi:hypothetical protein
MATYTWSYSMVVNGQSVAFDVKYDDTLVSNNITITATAGSLNVNALWFSNGDGVANDYGPTTLSKSDNSLNMNGSGETWDGYQKISSAGLTSTPPDSFIDASGGHSSFSITAGADFLEAFAAEGADLILGVRATSVNGGGSIKAVDDDGAAHGQLGPNLFTENFDNYDGTHYSDNGVPVFAVVNLNTEHGWTGAAAAELGADGYGTIPDTSVDDNIVPTPGAYWLDTQNSPGGVSMSHAFTDTTAPVDGKTAVLSFDIAAQSLDYGGQHYQTDPLASFEVRIDGAAVAEFTLAELMILTGGDYNEMHHVEVDIASYALAGNDHTIELVDTTAAAGYTGFAVDSIQINDWIVI